jgi:hypothetical protein
VTASSEDPSNGQLATKAVDGVVDGYPGDFTREWATLGQGAGAWLNLSWPTGTTLYRAVVFDRPNDNDQITAGTLVFSDGSTVAVGTLPNDGSGLTVNFTARAATSVRFNVTTVSGATENVGLAEIQVFGLTPPPPVPTATVTRTLTPTLTLTPTRTFTPVPGAPTSTFTRTPTRTLTLTVTATPPPAAVNIAPQATVTASSENATTSQLASKAIDGIVDGYPGDFSREWATQNQGAGAWIQLNWTGPQTISQVVLTDRPNTNDQITAGTLVFSDGSTVPVGALPNAGAPGLTINFTPRSVTSVRLNITSVSATTANVGLAEMQVFGASFGTPTNTPLPSATPTRTLTPAATSTFTRTPTRTPTLTATATLPLAATNIAPQATVTASSQNATTGQLATKAVDGVVDGYPGDFTREWATQSQGAGAWIQLNWATPRTLYRVVLTDRPNTNDQITAGTLVFSDGSTVPVGALPNAGAPGLTINFTPRSVTSVRLNITTVSGTTENVGLAEMQVIGL